MEAGIYIHIPFCISRCRYCDFFSTTDLQRKSSYVEALLQESCQRVPETIDIRTVYFGGGTPSLLDATDIKRVLDTLSSRLQPDAEITLEANPGDLTSDKLQAIRQAGINRLSIGIQSFQDPLLRTIGRRHDARQACEVVGLAQNTGISNISIDLIYGLPGQTMEQWEKDIAITLSLGVQHISCYCLSYEANTVLTAMRDKGEIQEQDDDTLNDMYDTLCQRLADNGYEHYEVSNFALPGFQSRHNSSYWADIPYIGLGAGAHSYDGTQRRWNIANLDQYIQGVSEGKCYYETETLTNEQKHIEYIMLGLRTNHGIKKEAISNQTQLHRYLRQGWLREDNAHIIATQSGLKMLNTIIEDLI